MTRWRVIELRTKAIYREYIQDDPPVWDESWPKQGQYALEHAEMTADERREWARLKRQEYLKAHADEFMEAVLFSAIGDSEFLESLKAKLSELLAQYPKDPLK